ncbi:MAG: class I SAM-dependent methyltransferase [Rickettsiales bacterium]|jgi:hypothetical protein|nr:class I SAM-dependent methyltransferase [Rickettsiales bacterium]
MNKITLNLYEQNRERTYPKYKLFLRLKRSITDFNDEKILLVGGGLGCYTFYDYFYQNCACIPNVKFTNVDLDTSHKAYSYIPNTSDFMPVEQSVKYNEIMKNIQADYLDWDCAPDTFDEIWALFSLPYYSPDITHAKLFFLKCILHLKPGGILRVGPTNFNNSVDGCATLPVPRESILNFFIKYVSDYKFTKKLNHQNLFKKKKRIILGSYKCIYESLVMKNGKTSEDNKELLQQIKQIDASRIKYEVDLGYKIH